MMTSGGTFEYDFNLTPRIFMIIILSSFSPKVLVLVVKYLSERRCFYKIRRIDVNNARVENIFQTNVY